MEPDDHRKVFSTLRVMEIDGAALHSDRIRSRRLPVGDVFLCPMGRGGSQNLGH